MVNTLLGRVDWDATTHRGDAINKKFTTPAILTGLALTFTGCASHSSPPAASISEHVSPSDEVLLAKAEQNLQQQCMRKAGFQLWAQPPAQPSATTRFPYMIDDVTWARQHGFGSDIEHQAAAAAKSDPNGAYFDALSATRKQQATEALNGPPATPNGPDRVSVALPTGITVSRSEHGCTSEAQTELYGDLSSWFTADKIVASLPTIRQAMVKQDPKFTAATTRWVTCMRASGHQYSSPDQARAAFVGPKPTGDPRSEIDTAVAEASCAMSTGLDQAAKDLDKHYAEVLDKQYASAIATKNRLEAAALPKARATAGS